jgi:hypothetical protein
MCIARIAAVIGMLLAFCTPKLTVQAHRKHPARDVNVYGGVPALPLEARVRVMPPVLAEYLVEDNVLNRFSTKPKPATLTETENALVTQTLANVPARLKAIAEKHVVGIFFVDDLGSTGFSDQLSGDGRASLLVFDRSVIMLDANTWATKKEKTVFEPGTPVTFTLRAPDDNKPGTALQYILLHELAHVIAHAKRAHPSPSSEDYEETALSRLSWEPFVRSDGEKIFVKKAEFRLEHSPGYYGAAPAQKVDQAPALYAAASKGCFASLYAMVHIGDDFAEALAIYAHVKWLGKPYAIDVGTTHFETPLFEARCKAKLDLVLKSLD